MTAGKLACTPWNPSRRAILRVKSPLPRPTCCPNCNSAVMLTPNSEVYGYSIGGWPWVYQCTHCDSYVGLHPFTDIPLGTLANAETRLARKKSKAPFVAYERRHRLTRTQAYMWLSEKLGIPYAECHFGWFDIATCNKVIEIFKDVK